MSTVTDTTHTNPFPGLRPFHEDEVHLFFGRENQVDAMVDKLAATRFLAVVGTSGSGKSSLVNCGLRPALFGGLLARAGSAWRVAQFRPGSDPLREMARTLAQDGVLFSDYESDGGLSLTDIVDTTLHMSKLGLVDIVEQARLAKGTNLLLVVDQFEELFRYRQLGTDGDGDNKDKHANISEQATAFVNLLLEAATQTKVPIYVVLTMRSDFLGDCAQFTGLAEAINAGQYLVPRMSRDERRAAIKGPVTVADGEISPLLLTRLLNDVGDNPDQLSILQHALNRTWAYWQNEDSGDGPLALTHYEAIGTMAHALDQHAQKAYGELGSKRQQQICEKIFKALTDKATDPRGIRRPTPMGTLCALADATPAEVTEVIDVFRQPSRSFLMPPAGEALLEQTMIDISHESLMRVWQRLNTWADEEAQSLQIYRRVVETAKLFAKDKASPWTGPDLQHALSWRDHDQPNETWAERYFPGFAIAMHFLHESIKIQEVSRQREMWRNRLVWILVPLMMPLALSMGLDEIYWDLSYLYIPIGALLGYAYRLNGLRALAIGAFLLLPPGFDLSPGDIVIPSNVSLYLLSLVVCRIFAEPDGFFAELNRFRDTGKFYLLTFLLLGITTFLGGDGFFLKLSLLNFAYGVFFILGMSSAQPRRFALALLLAVAAGSFFELNALSKIWWLDQFHYWLSSPWDFIEGLFFFGFGRLTRYALRGQVQPQGWTSVAVAGLALATLFAGSFINFSMDLTLSGSNSAYPLLKFGTFIIYLAAFTAALLLGARGVVAILIAGIGVFNTMLMLPIDGVNWSVPFIDAVSFNAAIDEFWDPILYIFISVSFGLLGNAVRKRFNAIGDGYTLAENQAAVRAAEESAQRTRRWLRWSLTSWAVAVVAVLLVNIVMSMPSSS
jgi:hypothetical protein